MAKLSVSIPDDQKDLLDAYAEKHGLGTSAVIQQALAAFLGSEEPKPTSDILDLRVTALEQYLKAFLLHYGLVRDGLEQLAGSSPDVVIPPAFPQPPWP